MDYSRAVRDFWEEWNIRGLVVLSQFLQFFIFFIAPYRQRTSNGIVLFIINATSVIVSPLVAATALSLMSNTKSDLATDQQQPVLLLWASIIMLHLGGYDPVRARSLEDRKSWYKPFFIFVFNHVVIFFFIYSQSTSIKTFINAIAKHNDKNVINGITSVACIPFVFMAYMRLYWQITSFSTDIELDLKIDLSYGKPDPGPYCAMIAQQRQAESSIDVMTSVSTHTPPCRGAESSSTAPISPLETPEINKGIGKSAHELPVVLCAFRFYRSLEWLCSDFLYRLSDFKHSRDFVLKNVQKAEDAIRLVEVELNFIYDSFFKFGTNPQFKATEAVEGKFTEAVEGKFLKLGEPFMASLYNIISIVGFVFYHMFGKQHSYLAHDKGITAMLLIGTIIIEFLCFFRALMSDWSVVALERDYTGRLNFGSRRSSTCGLTASVCRILFRRWSETIYQANIFVSSLEVPVWKKGWWKYVMTTCHWITMGVGVIILKMLASIKENMSGMSSEWYSDEWGKFIFNELKKKSEKLTGFSESVFNENDIKVQKELTSQRGTSVLEEKPKTTRDLLLPWVTEVTYEKSIFLWHIATELLCSQESEKKNSDRSRLRKLSKVISRYILYLLMKRRNIMLKMTENSPLTYRDTVADIKRFVEKNPQIRERMSGKRQAKKLCKVLLNDVNPDINMKKLKDIRGKTRSNSVLAEGCILAQQLKRSIENQDELWVVISKVWVEMLTYAAIHSNPIGHVEALAEGGELISIVWLLSAHMGLVATCEL